MATAQAALTPTADTTPAVVSITKELSGAAWVPRFPGSNSTDTLTPAFQASVDAFKAAMEAGGANVEIDATFRPKERAYLMHWAHKIYRNSTDPATVPAMVGVNIEWVHPTLALSTAAAKAMVVGYRIGHLGVTRLLHSTPCTQQVRPSTCRFPGLEIYWWQIRTERLQRLTQCRVQG